MNRGNSATKEAKEGCGKMRENAGKREKMASKERREKKKKQYKNEIGQRRKR